MKHHLIEIKNDLFNIAKRIKSVNRNFIICFNKIKNSFELYSKRFGKIIFEKDLGSFLNSNIILFVQKNNINNIEKIIKEIDLHNEKIDREKKEKSSDLSKQILKDMLLFANKKNCDVDFSKEKIL